MLTHFNPKGTLMNKIIDGKALAKEFNEHLSAEVAGLKKAGITPRITVIIIGNDPASEVYVKNKEHAAKKAGIKSIVERYGQDTTEGDILKRINELNKDGLNHGILIQLPLPKNYDLDKLLTAIDPAKDVDGFHPVNMGRLLAGQGCLRPCTPNGIIHLIESTGVDITGKAAVVVGRSNIVGKPVAIMLLEKNATVTIAHSRTKRLDSIIGGADIVVAAIGRPEFIKGDWIKKGAIVIDVGINKLEDGRMVGDVEFDSAKKRAGFITPVPGGVGPMTISMLLRNTVDATKKQIGR